MKAARLSLALLVVVSAAVSAPCSSADEEVVSVSPFLGSGGKAGPVV